VGALQLELQVERLGGRAGAGALGAEELREQRVDLRVAAGCTAQDLPEVLVDRRVVVDEQDAVVAVRDHR
jgi:hypothetical protein